MPPCPPVDLLTRLLAGELGGAEVEVIEAHVEGCASCRATLEELTAVSLSPPPHAPAATLDRELLERLVRRVATSGAVPPPLGAATRGDDVARGAGVPTLPGYRILRELGRGGMGVVHLAVHERLNRLCALKTIPDALCAGEDAVLRLLREAETIARLRQPGVVQIFHIGEHEGRTFLELEYLEGGTLAQQLDGTPWETRRAARLVEQLARSIDAAHRAGVIHRDLKPGNVLFTGDGTPKVADFGLARLDAGSDLTRSESVLGSPSYMAPEQAGGKARDVTPATDVHALGAILYELLVGRPPYRGAHVLETLAQVQSSEPVPPSRLVAGVPRDLETIVLRCLEKAPARRYPTAAELADDLRRFLAEEPIRARPPSLAYRFRKYARRNTSLVVGVASVIASLLLGAIVSTLFAWSEARQHALADEAARQAGAARLQAERGAYQARLVAGQVALGDHRIAEAARQLDAAAPAQRGWEWLHLRGRLDSSLAALSAGADQPLIGADLHGGSTAVLLPDPSHILLRDVEGRRADVRLDRDAQETVWPASADHRLLLIGGTPDGRFRVRDAAGRTLHALRSPERRGPWKATVSGDGRWLAVAYSWVEGPPLVRPSVLTFDLDRGAPVVRFELDGHDVAAMSFSPDGRLLAASTGSAATIWEAATGRLVADVSRGTLTVWSLAFHPDGARLLTGSADQSVREYEIETGRLLREIRERQGPSLAVAYSPDGRLTAWSGDDGAIRLEDSATGVMRVVLDGHRTRVDTILFSEDGSRLASLDEGPAGRTLRLWDLAAMLRDPLVLRGHESYVYAAAADPRGRFLATGGWDRTVRLWDFTTGAPSAVLVGHTSWISDIAFSPDGRILASRGADEALRFWDPASGRSRVVAANLQCEGWGRRGWRSGPTGGSWPPASTRGSGPGTRRRGARGRRCPCRSNRSSTWRSARMAFALRWPGTTATPRSSTPRPGARSRGSEATRRGSPRSRSARTAVGS